MKRTLLAVVLSVGLAVALGVNSPVRGDASSEAGPRPNIVVVLADDLGYGDLGCYGHRRIQTPHIDRFAHEGLKFTDCYAAAANCSPSRAGLMTGRTPFRVGIYNWIPMFSPMHVRESEVTIATILRDSGYDTCHAGKWHLNGDFNRPGQPQPSDHGFNHWFSTQNNALPNHRNPDNFVRNGTAVGRLEGYSADLVAGEVSEWLHHGRDRDKPFFVFACFHEPHEPIASAERHTRLYPSDDPSLSAHHGNVSQLDAGFGTILKALEESGVRDNTFVFFTSDNGPAITSIHPHGSPGPLRDKKGSIHDGGIRVPGIVQWPGHHEPGSVSDVPISGVDVLPTLCQLAGVEVPRDRELDGTSFLPVLSGEPLSRTKPLYWQFNRARSDAKVAMRDGDWKLVAGLTMPGPKSNAGILADEIKNIKKAELTSFQLFELTSDIAETTDVADANPETLQRMKRRMQTLYREVRGETPQWPAWQWPRYEAQRIEWPEYWRNRKND